MRLSAPTVAGNPVLEAAGHDLGHAATMKWKPSRPTEISVGGLHGEAAIHHERLAGDVATGVTDEEDQGRGQF
jgi:hypothetical protein